VRLYSRRGYNWADRYPRILEALRSLRVRSIVIDGEAVWCGKDGNSDFEKLHSGGYDASVLLYAEESARHSTLVVCLCGEAWAQQTLHNIRKYHKSRGFIVG
jgi:ATP-dependent DNA ligase